ncbi:hypothetical protein BH11PSE8_BH11PSE8_46280 [soil metagenome]
MAITKTEVVSARVHPDVKAALSAAAEAERRSVASMLEELWTYDMRANMPQFGKRTPFTRDYLRTLPGAAPKLPGEDPDAPLDDLPLDELQADETQT